MSCKFKSFSDFRLIVCLFVYYLFELVLVIPSWTWFFCIEPVPFDLITQGLFVMFGSKFIFLTKLICLLLLAF